MEVDVAEFVINGCTGCVCVEKHVLWPGCYRRVVTVDRGAALEGGL